MKKRSVVVRVQRGDSVEVLAVEDGLVYIVVTQSNGNALQIAVDAEQATFLSRAIQESMKAVTP